ASALTVALLHRRRPVKLKGVVLRQDSDPNKQLPIAGVEITAANSFASVSAHSDPSGYFSLSLPEGLRKREPVTMQFRHKDYQPLTLHDFVEDKIYLARMQPTAEHNDVIKPGPEMTVSNARVRYLLKATAEANIGSAVKTFQVANKANVGCDKRTP